MRVAKLKGCDSEMHERRRELYGTWKTPLRQGFPALVPIAVMAGALLNGCAFKAPSGRVGPGMSGPPLVDRPYRVRVGDQLDVRFYKTPELNLEKVPVRSDGKISVDLVGDVQAAGLEPDEIATNLVSAYSKELEDPRVAVVVREFGGQVFVGGEVGRPAAVKYAEGITALQAIQSAGGFKQEASRQNVVLVRKSEGRNEGYRLFLEDALTGKDYTQDAALQPNDVVFVPKSRISNVNQAVEQYITKNLPTIPISIPVF